MIFVMEILTALREYQHGYPDWKQPYRCVFETAHCYLRETGALTLHALAMEDAMCRMRRMCWIF
jgi:hypothetical protein